MVRGHFEGSDGFLNLAWQQEHQQRQRGVRGRTGQSHRRSQRCKTQLCHRRCCCGRDAQHLILLEVIPHEGPKPATFAVRTCRAEDRAGHSQQHALRSSRGSNQRVRAPQAFSYLSRRLLSAWLLLLLSHTSLQGAKGPIKHLGLCLLFSRASICPAPALPSARRSRGMLLGLTAEGDVAGFAAASCGQWAGLSQSKGNFSASAHSPSLVFPAANNCNKCSQNNRRRKEKKKKKRHQHKK